MTITTSTSSSMSQLRMLVYQILSKLDHWIIRLFIGFAIIIPEVRIGYELAIIISYPARAIVLLKMTQNTETYTKINIKMPPNNICKAWYHGS